MMEPALGAPGFEAINKGGSAGLQRRSRAGRPFWSVFFLGIFTLGIYLLYYWWAVFREVDQASGHRHAAGIYALFIALLVAGLTASVVEHAPTASAQDGAGQAGPSSVPLPKSAASMQLVLDLTVSNLLAVAAGLAMVVYQAVEMRSLSLATAAVATPPGSRFGLPATTALAVLSRLLAGPGGGLLALAFGVVGIAYWADANARVNQFWAARAEAHAVPAALGLDTA